MSHILPGHEGPPHTTYGHEVRDGPAIDRDPEVLTRLNLAKNPSDLVAQLALWNDSHASSIAHLLRMLEV